MTFTADEARLFVALQRPWPLTERPLRTLAENLGTTEAALLNFITRLRAKGLVRRIGGVFDGRRLGAVSSLFALCLRGPEADAAAARLAEAPGVTHIYLRGWPKGVVSGELSAEAYRDYPSLWYTLTAPANRFRKACAPFADLNPIPFPALKRYKIDVILGAEAEAHTSLPLAPMPTDPVPVTPPDGPGRVLIHRYQDDTDRPEAPFRPEDLPTLRAWQADGRLRRFALLPYHHSAGFTANGMCCWPVAESALDRFGARLAAEPSVTHCYARPAAPNFPFTLYAMIHRHSWEEGIATFRELTRKVGLPTTGRILFSLKEYKKTSPRLFDEA